MNTARNQKLLLLSRAGAAICGAVAAILAVYAGILVYAGATFEGDGLPGPMVLYMVAVGLGLAALLCAGLAHVLWRRGKPRP